MEETSAEHIILEKLYTSYFQERSALNLHGICEELGMDKTAFWNIVEYMSHKDLIKAWSMGGNYIIQSFGVLHAEEAGIAPIDLIEENRRVRTIALDKLASVHEARGSYADTHIEHLSKESGIDLNALANNMQVLEDLGYVETVAMGSYRITHEGLEFVDEWRQRTGLAREFEHISDLEPQPRGRALQKLLSRVIEKDGWLQEEGARTSHEEMDIIIHKEREYYLIECKWEKDPIQARIVRELFGKLSNRIGVQGILVSMSGFTEGAAAQAEAYASSRVILFFGSEDIENVFYGKSSFEVLLNEKYQQLITRRNIAFS